MVVKYGKTHKIYKVNRKQPKKTIKQYIKSKVKGGNINEEDFFKTTVDLLNSHLYIHRKYPQIYLDESGNMINIHNEINKLENSSFFEQNEFSVFTFLNQ